jgi:hypothetical protein
MIVRGPWSVVGATAPVRRRKIHFECRILRDGPRQAPWRSTDNGPLTTDNSQKLPLTSSRENVKFMDVK